MSTAPTTASPPSRRPFVIALLVIAAIVVATTVTVGLRNGVRAAEAATPTAYTADELSREVTSQLALRCHAFSRDDVCQRIRGGTASAYGGAASSPFGAASPSGGSGGASAGSGGIPSVRCLSGVSAEDPTATCLVSSSGRPRGPVSVHLILTTRSTGWFLQDTAVVPMLGIG